MAYQSAASSDARQPAPGFWKPGTAAPELCGVGSGQFDRENEKEDLVQAPPLRFAPAVQALIPFCPFAHSLLSLIRMID